MTNVTVKCPKCNSFLIRATACEDAEINCIDKGCGSTFVITVRDGQILSLKGIERPKFRGFAQRT